MKVPVFDISGNRAGEQQLSDELFGVTVKKSVLHQVVVWQMAARRAGTASTKTRSEVRGGGRKPFKQKGTGQARAGSTRSPLWRKGGVSHGPQPRDWSQGLPKRVRKLGVRMALANRVQLGHFGVLSSAAGADGKTKSAKAMLEKLGQSRVLFITKGDGSDAAFANAMRNVPGCKVLPEVGTNVYDILNHTFCLVEANALPVIEARLQAGR